jgi:steroid 5-alpha reductase family enzyme
VACEQTEAVWAAATLMTANPERMSFWAYILKLLCCFLVVFVDGSRGRKN